MLRSGVDCAHHHLLQQIPHFLLAAAESFICLAACVGFLSCSRNNRKLRQRIRAVVVYREKKKCGRLWRGDIFTKNLRNLLENNFWVSKITNLIEKLRNSVINRKNLLEIFILKCWHFKRWKFVQKKLQNFEINLRNFLEASRNVQVSKVKNWIKRPYQSSNFRNSENVQKAKIFHFWKFFENFHDFFSRIKSKHFFKFLWWKCTPLFSISSIIKNWCRNAATCISTDSSRTTGRNQRSWILLF